MRLAVRADQDGHRTLKRVERLVVDDPMEQSRNLSSQRHGTPDIFIETTMSRTQ